MIARLQCDIERPATGPLPCIPNGVHLCMGCTGFLMITTPHYLALLYDHCAHSRIWAGPAEPLSSKAKGHSHKSLMLV